MNLLVEFTRMPCEPEFNSGIMELQDIKMKPQNIPLVDLGRQYKTIRKEIDGSIRKVILSSDFILGQELKKFEEEFAQFCQTKYAVGVDSGTGALELALAALGIGKGDEVMVPVFTFYATASAVASCGATPVFVDVEKETGNMDPEKIKEKITRRTRAVIPVHLFGQPANLTRIISIAKKYKLHLIEDAAQAHGARVRINGGWKSAGSVGEMGCFSFYPGKNLGAYGDGGMVATNQKSLANRLKLLRDYGRVGKYEHNCLGFNKRLDTIQAAILRVKLKKLNQWNELRRKHAALYDRRFAEIGVKSFKIRPFALPVRHVYAILAPNRDGLAAFLNREGIATGIHYPVPLHLQKSFRYLGYKSGDFPAAEEISEKILSLPIFPELKKAEIEKIVLCIKKFYQ